MIIIKTCLVWTCFYHVEGSVQTGKLDPILPCSTCVIQTSAGLLMLMLKEKSANREADLMLSGE